LQLTEQLTRTHLRLGKEKVCELEGQPDCVEPQQPQRLNYGGKVATFPAGCGLGIQAIYHGFAVVEPKPEQQQPHRCIHTKV
jgi:hypothetical protein